MPDPKPSCSRWKTALGVVVLFAALGWIFAWPAYQRHRAIREIERVGGHAIVEGKGPEWLGQRGLWFHGVVVVRIEDAEIENDGLRHLNSLAEIEHLVLCNSEITETELAHLGGLSKLNALFLYGSTVDDAGLKHLKRLSRLKVLDLTDTQVTAAGVKELQAALPDCEIQPNKD